jgi:hypothetical protein
MKYAVEMGSGTYSKFHKAWFPHPKVDGARIHRQHGDRIRLLLFFKLRDVV